MNVGELKARLLDFNDAQLVVVAGDTIYEDGFIGITRLENIKLSPTQSSKQSSWMGEYCENEDAFIMACLLNL